MTYVNYSDQIGYHTGMDFDNDLFSMKYSSKAKQQYWTCSYCGYKNREDMLKCHNCGGPET